MPTGLDKFYRYIERQGQPEEVPAPLEEVEANPPAKKRGRPANRPALTRLPGEAEPGVRYVLRNGITVAVPVEEAVLEETVVVATPAPTVITESGFERKKPGPKPGSRRRSREDNDDNGTSDENDDLPDYLPPIVDAHEPPLVADAPTRPRPRSKMDSVPEEEALPDGIAAALWKRLPRHIQLLVGMHEPEMEEVAAKYYTRGFKENRQQLIERLLDPTLTLEDTARVLAVCPTTVRRYTNRGVLPHHRTLGQQRRFRLSDVLAFLERQQRAKKKRALIIEAKLAEGRNGNGHAA